MLNYRAIIKLIKEKVYLESGILLRKENVKKITIHFPHV